MTRTEREVFFLPAVESSAEQEDYPKKPENSHSSAEQPPKSAFAGAVLGDFEYYLSIKDRHQSFDDLG